MAYFCLTVLETVSGSRKNAARRFSVDVQVLKRIGVLASKHGDRTNARKASSTEPLTGSEEAWLDAAIKAVIFRVGDKGDPRTLTEITFRDLPPL
jgi:hypothetical protein